MSDYRSLCREREDVSVTISHLNFLAMSFVTGVCRPGGL